MSTNVSLELIKQLKELGIWRFKTADFEVEFFATKVYPGAAAEPLPEPTPEMAWPPLSEDRPGIDDGSEYRKLLEWST